MSRKIRQTKDNNIVIVCEGSETEAPYFEALKAEIKRVNPHKYAEILIVPIVEEKVMPSARRTDKKKRLQKPAERTYWMHQEETQELYDEYCAQPVKYVREAELFMIHDGFVEAWAVFDHDNIDIRQRNKAFEHAESVDNLNIAFSSIAFEEWILAHFERNPKPFEKAQCKERGKAIDCGKDPGIGCNGDRCLAGYLRRQQYLPDYKKNDHTLFETLRSRFDTAQINAAWLRHLEGGPIYERNPYTDVDKLVARMLEVHTEYEWVKLGETFTYMGARIIVTKDESGVRIHIDGACLLTKENLLNIDLVGGEHRLFDSNLYISNDVSESLLVIEPYLCFVDGWRRFLIDLG